jgi:septation ring formation regulator EzrA
MTNNDNEVIRLTRELERLQIEISKVNNRLRQLEDATQVKRRISQMSMENTIRIGDIVEVTNRYKGRLGVRGKVIKVTSAQVLIEANDNGETFRKYKANVRIIR